MLFTREAQTVAVVVAVVVGASFVVAIMLPVMSVYRANGEAEATLIRARAAAEADQIRAMGFYRADTCVENGARLVLELKAIEAGR